MISLEEVESKYVTKENRIIQLQNINLTINYNETIAIVGKTNYERTALLRCLAYLDPPKSGNFKFDQLDFTALPNKKLIQARRNIGLVTQEKSLLQNKNVLYNIASNLILDNVPKNIWLNKANEVLSVLNLTNKAYLYPQQLSKLQKILVCLGRALLTNPKVFILDDITNGLDPKNASFLIDKLKELKQKRNLSFIIATNDLEVIKHLCDKIIIINNCKIIEFTATEKFLLSPKSTIGKEYIKAKARLELPIALRKQLRANHRSANAQCRAIIRSVFDSANNSEAIIGEIIERLETKVNIITAHAEKLPKIKLNLMLLELQAEREDKIMKAIALLNEHYIYTEVLGYVE